MSANATGTPTTNFSIPKFNTASDAPNGKGVNEMMDALDSLIADTTKVASSKIASLTSGDVPVWNGTGWVRSGTTAPVIAGYEMKYQSFTADVSITHTTSGTADTVVSSGSVATDGTPLWIEFFAPNVVRGTNQIAIGLWVDGAENSLFSLPKLSDGGTIFAKIKSTPSAGSHTYDVKAYVDAGTGTVHAGTGAPGNYPPGFIRIVKA